jgi:cell division protein FtsB
MEGKNSKWSLLRRSDHNYFIPYVIIVTTLVALWLLFFSHASVLNWIRAGVEVKNQEQEMARLGREIEEMDAEIEDLTHNRDSIEAYARETYRFAAPGDDVYIVE